MTLDASISLSRRAAGANVNASTILCVDDEPAVAKTTQLVLEGAGYSVSTAATAEEAFQLVHARHFDLVLIDRIPNCAWVVAEARRVNPYASVVIFTGDSELTNLPLVDVVLHKPLSPRVLLNTTAELLSRLRAA